MTWREHFRPIIAKVIKDTGTIDMRLLRKKLRQAFPVPPRQYHPYKIWLDEIQVQLGLKKPTKKSDLPGQMIFASTSKGISNEREKS